MLQVRQLITSLQTSIFGYLLCFAIIEVNLPPVTVLLEVSAEPVNIFRNQLCMFIISAETCENCFVQTNLVPLSPGFCDQIERVVVNRLIIVAQRTAPLLASAAVRGKFALYCGLMRFLDLLGGFLVSHS